MIQPQWTVEAEGDSEPLTVTVQVTQVTVATKNGDQIALATDQIAPLIHRLDRIYYYDLTCDDS